MKNLDIDVCSVPFSVIMSINWRISTKKFTTKKLKQSSINHNYSVNLEYKQKMNINHLKKENMFTDINDNKSPQVAMLEAMILSSTERKILKTTAVGI